MKLGRIITTHRQDLILALKDFYLGSKTEFLVIAYNRDHVNPSGFVQADDFKLVPYLGRDRYGRSARVQWKVWPAAAALFPDIGAWVVHDYDVLCKPSDQEILSRLGDNQYAMLGRPIPLWQAGMPERRLDVFPFRRDYRFLKQRQLPAAVAGNMEGFETVLKQNFPNYFDGISTVLCGYGDILAASAKTLSLLLDPRLEAIPDGGVEQVPFSVFGNKGISAVDLRKWYSIKASNAAYVPFNNAFDISHPVKYWPVGLKPRWQLQIKTLVKGWLYPRFGISRPEQQ